MDEQRLMATGTNPATPPEHTKRLDEMEREVASGQRKFGEPTPAFSVGDPVEKYTGEAQWKGEVVASYLTTKGKRRYVVEVFPQGFQMIAVPGQLRLAEPRSKAKVSDEMVSDAFKIYAATVGLESASGLLRAKCAMGLRAVLEAMPQPKAAPAGWREAIEAAALVTEQWGEQGSRIAAAIRALQPIAGEVPHFSDAIDPNAAWNRRKRDEPSLNRTGLGQSSRGMDAIEAGSRRDFPQERDGGGVDGALRSTLGAGEESGPQHSESGLCGDRSRELMPASSLPDIVELGSDGESGYTDEDYHRLHRAHCATQARIDLAEQTLAASRAEVERSKELRRRSWRRFVKMWNRAEAAEARAEALAGALEPYADIARKGKLYGPDEFKVLHENAAAALASHRPGSAKGGE